MPSDETIDAAEARAKSAQREGMSGSPYSTKNKFGDGHQAPKSAAFNIKKVQEEAQAGERGAVSTFREQITSMKRRAFSGEEEVDWKVAFGVLIGFIIVHWVLNLRKPALPNYKPKVDLPAVEDEEALPPVPKDAGDVRPARSS